MAKFNRNTSGGCFHDGRAIMRAVDEFWGEYWPVGNVVQVEIHELLESCTTMSGPDSMLDEVHVFDAHGALAESVFYDDDVPYLMRKNEYDSADCIAKRTSTDVETGESTMWLYTADPANHKVIALVHSTRPQETALSDIYMVDVDGRISTCDFNVGSTERGDRWLVRRNGMGHIVATIVQDEPGTDSIIWRNECNEQGEPVKIGQFTPDGILKSERTLSYVYDINGNWTEEKKVIIDYGRDGPSRETVTKRKRIITYR